MSICLAGRASTCGLAGCVRLRRLWPLSSECDFPFSQSVVRSDRETTGYVGSFSDERVMHMKGFRFYEELRNKNRKDEESVGTVVALYTGEGIETSEIVSMFRRQPEACVAVFSHPNSAVCWSGVSWEYLRDDCRRISEAEARAIHPALFKELDSIEYEEVKA